MNTHSCLTALSDRALLALLVGDSDSRAMAHRPLVDLFQLHPLPLALRETPASPTAERILGAAKELMARALRASLRERCVLSTPSAVRDYLRLQLADRDHEVFSVMMLDSQHQLIADVILFRGTLSQTSVSPREVVKLALSYNAASVIFAHNHPSGANLPSQADVHLTETLKQALALVDVRTVDHFIVAGTAKPLSMAEQGLL